MKVIGKPAIPPAAIQALARLLARKADQANQAHEESGTPETMKTLAPKAAAEIIKRGGA